MSSTKGILLVGVLICVMVEGSPPIPKIAGAFQTTFSFKDLLFDPLAKAMINFDFALDKNTGGGRLHIYGEEVFPFYLETHVIAYPNGSTSGMQGYWFEGNVCWQEKVAVDYLKILPLNVPADAVFEGYREISGQVAQGWSWGLDVRRRNHTVRMWLNNVTTDAFPVYLTMLGDRYWGDAILTFSNTKVGPISPTIYDPPKLHCISPPWAETPPATKAVKDAVDVLKSVLQKARDIEPGMETAAARVPADVPSADPTEPPTLVQQFFSNFTFVPAKLTMGMLQLQLWLDYTIGAGKLIISGEDFFPLDLETNIVLHPYNGTFLVAFWYYGPNCINFGAPADFLEMYPLKIKKNAKYMGTKTIRGIDTVGWKWESTSWWSNLTYWVTPQQYNASIVSIEATTYRCKDCDFNLEFSKTSPGPINPRIYAVPNVTCFPTAPAPTGKVLQLPEVMMMLAKQRQSAAESSLEY